MTAEINFQNPQQYLSGIVRRNEIIDEQDILAVCERFRPASFVDAFIEYGIQIYKKSPLLFVLLFPLVVTGDKNFESKITGKDKGVTREWETAIRDYVAISRNGHLVSSILKSISENNLA